MVKARPDAAGRLNDHWTSEKPVSRIKARLMSARLLVEVALRLLGLWFAFNSFISLAATVPYYLFNVWNSASNPIGYFAAYLVLPVVMSAFQFALGAALIKWAPRIAARFYPPDAENEELLISVGPGDVFRTACFVLGAYLLINAVRPACRLIIAGFQISYANQSSQLASDAVTTIVYAVGGMLLVFGSDKIGEWLSNLRYDPNTIPKPQFSIATLLILLVLFAVCLEVIRRITTGGL